MTYALNPLLNYTSVSRALSINNKRQNINLKDVLLIAEEYAIKNPKGIVEEIEQVTSHWQLIAKEVEISEKIINRIENDFVNLS